MSKKKLLVADDSLTIQKVLRLALSSEGYEIEAVSDGADASQQIPLFRPDIILVDVSLPGKTAYALKEEYNQDPDRPSTRFILMSSAFETIDEDRFESLGFDGRLIKPFDPANLREVLNSVSAPQSPAPKSTPSSDDLWSEDSVPVRPSPEMFETTSTDHSGLDPVEEQSAQNIHPEEDIKNLTETTIKMSGLDNVDWNLSEPARKNEEDKDSTQDLEIDPHSQRAELVGEKTYTDFQIPDPTLPVQQNMTDTEGVSFHLDESKPDPVSPPEAYQLSQDDLSGGFSIQSPLPPPPPAAAMAPTHSPTFSSTPEISESTAPSPISISEDEIKALISKEIQETIQKTIREQLPDIAERIIKEEISKLLANPPQ